MGRFFVSRTWVLVLALLLASPVVARAGGCFTRPCGGGSLLRFGSTYSLAGKKVVHRGLDIQAGEGEEVLAAANGVVSFAGQVPADGGGRVAAVTVTTDDGMLVCVSPLSSTCVKKGDYVSAGDLVGALAGSGDGSVGDTHVHLSVRDEGVYVDPEPLLGQPTAAAIVEPGPSEGSAAEVSVSGVAPSGAAAAGVGVGSAASLSAERGVASLTGATIPGLASSVLGAQIAETVRGPFSAEISRLRMRQGVVHTEGFSEPRLADVVSAAVTRSGVAVPASAADLGLLLAAAGCVLAIQKLRQEAAVLPALGRER